jgi:hypothetical protein
VDSYVPATEAVGQAGRLATAVDEPARTRFIRLLVGIEKRQQDEVDREALELIALLAMLDEFGLRRSQKLIATRLHFLGLKLDALASEKRQAVAQLGMDAGRDEFLLLVAAVWLAQLDWPGHFASDAADQIASNGSRGVPLVNAIAKFASDAAFSITGRINRALFAKEDFRTLAGDIRARLTGRRVIRGRTLTERNSLLGNVATETRTDLNAAYARALELWSAANQELMTLIWRVSPAYDGVNCHVPVKCGHFQGMTQQQAEKEGATIPRHRNCMCYWQTKFDEGKLQRKLGL